MEWTRQLIDALTPGALQALPANERAAIHNFCSQGNAASAAANRADQMARLKCFIKYGLLTGKETPWEVFEFEGKLMNDALLPETTWEETMEHMERLTPEELAGLKRRMKP
jgi:hypothetical protein